MLVHASLVTKSHQVDHVRPPDIGDEERCEAMDERILHLEVDMNLVSKTWWIVGIYQHVAKPGNAELDTF